VGWVGDHGQTCLPRPFDVCTCVGEADRSGVTSQVRGGILASACWAMVVTATRC